MVSHRADPGSSPGQVMWDLWWTKWHWGRFSPGTSVSLANLHFTNCSTIRSIVAAVPSGLKLTPLRIKIKKEILEYRGNLTFLPLPGNSTTTFSVHSLFPLQAEYGSTASVWGDTFSYEVLCLSVEELFSPVMELQRTLTWLSSVSIWLLPDANDPRRGLQYWYRSRTALEGDIYERGEHTARKMFPNLSIQT
jgi:hypothetical protein